MVDVSVIIVNLNSKELLRRCLLSVFNCKLSFEVILVDNGSTDGAIEMIEAEFPTVKLIKNRTNQLFARPNNEAMKIAQGRYYFLLNNDTYLKEDVLEELVSFMDKNLQVGIIGPQLLNPDGSIQPSCKGEITLWTHFCDALALDRLFPKSKHFASFEMSYFDHKTIREVDHIMAAAILVRKEAILKIGMFDEKLSLYLNDMDLSLRMRKAGWKILFYPQVQVVHYGGQTTSLLNQNFFLFDEMYNNVFYYYQKHFGTIGFVIYKLLLIIAFLFRIFYWSILYIFKSTPTNKHILKFSMKSLYKAINLERID